MTSPDKDYYVCNIISLKEYLNTKFDKPYSIDHIFIRTKKDFVVKSVVMNQMINYHLNEEKINDTLWMAEVKPRFNMALKTILPTFIINEDVACISEDNIYIAISQVVRSTLPNHSSVLIDKYSILHHTSLHEYKEYFDSCEVIFDFMITNIVITFNKINDITLKFAEHSFSKRFDKSELKTNNRLEFRQKTKNYVNLCIKYKPDNFKILYDIINELLNNIVTKNEYKHITDIIATYFIEDGFILLD